MRSLICVATNETPHETVKLSSPSYDGNVNANNMAHVSPVQYYSDAL